MYTKNMMKTFLRRHGWPMNHTQAKPSFYIPAKFQKSHSREHSQQHLGEK